MEKLDSKRIENILALTPLQEGILFHYLRAPQGPLYFEQLSLEISGEIELCYFEKAWDSVIETNEMLRTVFRWEKVEKPSQIILKKHKCSVFFYDLSDNDDSRKKTALEEIKKKDRRETFDLHQVPPFRVILCKLAEKEFEMVISNHHILYDGWSTGIILKEFFAFYQGFRQDGRSPKLSVKPRFKEFITWIQNQDKNKQEQYWRNYLAGLETHTELPIKMRMEETTGAGDISIILEGDFKKKLAVFTKNNRVTLAAVFYSAWGILLHRYCSSADVIFGTTVSGRSAPIKGIENMVGLLINTVPLRIRTTPGEKIIDVIFRTDQVLQEREKFECTPLPEIRGYSSVSGSGPLFDTIVVIENYPLDSRLLPGNSLLSIHSYSMVEMTHYDLTLGIMPFNEIEIKFSYKTELFEKETIENLARHFKGIVQNIVENPGVVLSQLELMSGEEKNRILYEFNNTAAEYPTNKTIQQLFVEQASRTPDRIALVGAGLRACPAFSDFSVGPVGPVRPVRTVSLSYNELNRQSDRLAGSLIEKGVLADNIVAIMVERSIEMVAGILGILKAGGAYLPIDPEYPQGRIEYMLKDSSAKLLLTGDNLEFSSLTSYLPNFLTSHPFNLAYIIYTSGSTGKPKGVMVNHGSVVNLLFAMQDQYPFKPQDTYLLKTSYIFDVSVTELFGWYMGGGRLAVLEKDGEKDPGIILDYIERYEVTHINFVPPMCSAFIEHAAGENKNRLAALRYLFLAGETLPPELVEKSGKLGNGIALENIYGPTEGTVYAAKYSLSGWGGGMNIPIGSPLSNIELYILNKYNHLQPLEIPGELCIAGNGVARGYLNNPELTAEKFIDFHHSSFTIHHSILYRTGDLARWLNDGNIQFLGRIDNQVKIRGFRIELGEIEDRLLKHKHVKEAVVTVTESNIPQLQAYIVLKNDEPGTIEKNEKKPGALEFREYLSLRLPDYMIPAHFFLLGKIPLTPSGKINRKALQAANTLLGTGVEYISPKSDIEKTIAGVWQDLLGLDKVGIHDNFFDLGGNSLSIIRLNSRLKVALPDKKDISVVTLFNHPTIASLARYLNREENETVSEDVSENVSVMTAKKIKSYFKSEQVEIAVIGMAGRFPGAKNIDEFRDNIKNGVESIRFFTREELAQLGVEAELINNPDYVPAKGVLESKECFDSFFFDYTPAEAEILDPQVRLFHECTWEALENAGYDPFRYGGIVGLYAGASPNPLWEIFPLTSGTVGGSYPELWNALQFSDKDYLSTRIAYKLDLKGPCVTIQTACSTSLVAVDHACRALVSGACTIALAGGVSITVQDEAGYLYQEGTIMSPDGHCRAFDAGAGGTVGGNGVGVVVLKRLEEARTDGDMIYAVVKGFAVNNDGRNKVGFTAPSSEGQCKAIRDALDMADVNPESIGYIETHGTGTLLGDPIEIEGLKMAFNAANPRKKHYCALGSVKTNIGHLDAAAGIAGFIKTVLSLHHRFIPPSLNFKTPNPQIDFENSPFYVNTKLKTWESNEYPRRAGVSSFGLGGTNVHVVLEEYIKQYIKQRPGILFSEKEKAMAVQEGGGAAPSGPPKTFDKVVLLSAKTPAALERISENLARHFEQNPGIDLANAAYTLQVGRKSFTHRKMLVCSDTHEAIRKLQPGEAETAAAKEEKHTVIFMFSGQGSQYVNMGLDLYHNEPVFHRQIDECFELLEKITGIAMKPVLYPSEEKISIEEAEEKIFQFKYTTPIKFIFEYSLAKMLMTWGIRPDAMIGHSFGEYTAACLAGVFSLADGLFLAALRGELMHGLPGGAMLSVPLSEKELHRRLTAEIELCIAAIDGESLGVVSGPVEAVNRFEEQLNREGHDCLRFQVPKAGHSRMVEPIMAEFKQKIGKVKFHKPRIPFISCVSGTWITAEEAVDPAYWTRHLRETVRFADGLTTLFKEPNPVFLQSSPGKGLILFINQHPDYKEDTPALSMVRHRKEPVSDIYHTLTQIGRLWLHGCDAGINWPAIYQEEGEKRRRIPLPSYPFEPIPYPVNRGTSRPGSPVMPSFSKETAHRELRKKTSRAEWFYAPSWERVMLTPDAAPTKGGEPRQTPYILLFMDGWGLGRLLKERLEQDGAVVTTVHLGTAFEKTGERSYIINPSIRENDDELLKELESQGEMPSRVYYLWSLSRWDPDKQARDNVNEALDRGFYGLLFLVQALGKRDVNTGQGIRIAVVTGGVLEVSGEEDLCPAGAPVYGLCRVIPQEYPDIDCRCIDITLPGTSIGTLTGIGEKRVKQLTAEFSSGLPDRVVAYRGDYRWVETFKPLRLENPQPGALPLKERGVYVITGGLGAIGMVLAEYLARTFKARLVLTGRSDFPPRQEWELGELGREKFSRKIQRLLAMEEAGAEVLVVKAGVSNLEQMQAVFLRAEEKFGPVNGVIHSAGIVGETSFCPLKDMGKPEAQLHFEPKIYGLLVLAELLKNRPVDFCLCMSSTASLLGGLGFGAYAAANRFMDAYIYMLNRTGQTRWISVNWDGWQLEEKQIRDTALGAEIKELAMTPQEGMDTFARILGWPEAKQVIECTGDLQSRLDRWVKLRGLQSSNSEAETGEEKSGTLLRRPRSPLSSPYIPPRNSREKEVAGIWSELLGYDQIGVRDNFFELNGDSLKAVIAISKIHKQVDVKVPLTDFFATPTVEGIAAYIARAKGITYYAVEPVEKKAYYPLSSAQKRLYIFQQLQPGSTAYNIPSIYRLTGNFDKEKFQGIFVKMIQRHEALRTTFFNIKGEMVQAIAGHGDFNMTYWELDEAEALARIPDLVKPFDLRRAPLLRVVLIKVQEQNYIIFFDMHHIISDRGSIEILIDNIFRLYQGENIKPLHVQYKDYVARLEKQLKEETLSAQEKYWMNRLQGFIFTRLPIDYLKPGDRVKGSARYHEIGLDFYHKIDHFCMKHNVTKFIFLITVFQITLARKLDQWDITLGIPSAIRDNPDLKQVIGIFLNILLIRTAIDYNETFLTHLSKNKNIVSGALDNQDYPYEMLIDKIRAANPANPAKKNELFSILFNYITMDTDQKRTFPGFQINPLTMPEISPRYDITVYGHEGVDRINLSLVYKSDIYSEDSIRKLLTDFLETVQRALDDGNMTITQLTTWDRPDIYDMDKDSEIDMYYNRGESL